MVDHALPPGTPPTVAVSNAQDLQAPSAYAALDLGTNNCRLLIAAPTRHGFRVIDSFSRIVRLGEGLHGSGCLSEAAMERTIAALHACATRIGRRRLRGIHAVATEACRRAENGPAFLARVRHETGLAIHVISTREEAELALESCAALLQADLPERRGPDTDPIDGDCAGALSPVEPDPASLISAGRQRGDLRPNMDLPPGNGPVVQPADRARSRALLFDIGGGSTEIAWVRVDGSSGRDDSQTPGRPELVGYQSLPLGVITLSELFGAHAFTPEGYEAMVEHVLGQLRRFDAIHCIGREVRRGAVRLLGTSGTVTTLASIALDLRRYRRILVDGVVLSRDAAQDAIAVLRALGADGLGLHGCIGPDRAHYVLPGCAIFDAIHRLWPTDSVVVADRGLRDGMLLRMMRDRKMMGSPFEAARHHLVAGLHPRASRPMRADAAGATGLLRRQATAMASSPGCWPLDGLAGHGTSKAALPS